MILGALSSANATRCCVRTFMVGRVCLGQETIIEYQGTFIMAFDDYGA